MLPKVESDASLRPPLTSQVQVQTVANQEREGVQKQARDSQKKSVTLGQGPGHLKLQIYQCL